MTTEKNLPLPKDRVLEISDFDEDKQRELRLRVQAWDAWIEQNRNNLGKMLGVKIIPWVPEMQHVSLTCRNHPHLCWSTKNYGGIGQDGHVYLARSLFFFGEFIDPFDEFNDRRFSEYSQVIYLDAEQKEVRIAHECQCPGSDLIGLVPQ
jgi:hypothetical protein